MLECNLKLVGRVLLFANARKSTRKSTHGTRLCGVAQGLHIVLSWASVGWSEPENIYFLSHDIYFLSHDIQHVLYLVLLYGDSHDVQRVLYLVILRTVFPRINAAPRIVAALE